MKDKDIMEITMRLDALEKMVALGVALARVLLENTGHPLTTEAARLEAAANALIDVCDRPLADVEDYVRAGRVPSDEEGGEQA